MAKKVKTEERQKSNIYGWSSVDDVTEEISVSRFKEVLDGDLVFAYRNQGDTGTIRFLVVTKTPDGLRFGLEFLCGVTYYYPKTTKDHLTTVVIKDLEKNKTEDYIIEDFLEYINNYDKA